MQGALAQEISSSAAIHATLDQLEALNLPFDGAVTPRLDDGGAHGWLVLPKPGDEAAEIVPIIGDLVHLGMLIPYATRVR